MPSWLPSWLAGLAITLACVALPGCEKAGTPDAPAPAGNAAGGPAASDAAPAAGETPAAAAAPATTDRRRIGVSLMNVQHSFYQDLRKGLEAEAARHGYELLVVSADFNQTRQANQVDDFIVRKIDAIVLCPCDSMGVGACITAANEAGIPVFTADISNLSGKGKVVSHIASDNQEGGRKAAELLAAAIGGKGKVAVLTHPEVASVMDRVAGFKEKIATHSDITIAAELSSGGQRDKAAKVMEDLLQSHPDLAGVFGVNDDSALGALAAIEAAGLGGKIKIVGYDATEEARARIADGSLYGDVIQNPQRIGELTIGAVHDHLTGKTPPEVIPVEVGTHTK
jgi:ribose transport system substrate-binding protein